MSVWVQWPVQCGAAAAASATNARSSARKTRASDSRHRPLHRPQRVGQDSRTASFALDTDPVRVRGSA